MTSADPPQPIWRPGPEAETSELARYTAWLSGARGCRFDGYDALWRWSVDELEAFWGSIWDYFQVESSRPYRRVLGERQMPGAEWFPGAELSYAAHVFRGRRDEDVAIVHASELREQRELRWGELRELTAAIAGGLRSLGVGPGDRVAAYMPNVAEAAAAFLACASLGAVWTACSPEFGARSAADRFAQVEPKVLLCVDGYRYGGRDVPRGEAVNELRRALPSLVAAVALPYLDPQAALEDALAWEQFLRPGPLAFEQLPFSHPLWVLYSSGTTGLPKPIVHGHGGILLEHLKELHFHLDARPSDRLFWFTTTGWMMWNLLLEDSSRRRRSCSTTAARALSAVRRSGISPRPPA